MLPAVALIATRFPANVRSEPAVHLQSDPSLSVLRPIFMLDDEEVDRVLFARLLRDAEVKNPSRIFSRGEDLIDAMIAVLRGAPPPLVCFLDVKMPGMNGFDVLRWIRCQQACNDIPVVMLSSSTEPRDLNEAHHSGAQCYIPKFPRPDAFCQILDEAARVAAANSPGPFKLPCNLLLSSASDALLNER